MTTKTKTVLLQVCLETRVRDGGYDQFGNLTKYAEPKNYYDKRVAEELQKLEQFYSAMKSTEPIKPVAAPKPQTFTAEDKKFLQECGIKP
jgi:hypothetical protein